MSEDRTMSIPVDGVDQGLAAGEQGLGAALDRVAGVDQHGVRVLVAQARDEGGHACQPSLRRPGAVGADVRPGDEVAVQVTDVDEADPSGHGTHCAA